MEGIHMLNLKDINWKKPGLFAAGVAFGTAGIKILTSDDAKKSITAHPGSIQVSEQQPYTG